MPCAFCGSFNEVEMHHIKHVRKTAYRLIAQPENFQQIMSLRNRKQIPLCTKHHREFVHKGLYHEKKLINLAPKNQTLIDNRIIHLESFIKPGIEYLSKNILEKGWKKI